MSATPAGWFPDPSTRHELRYWDGTVWTSHVSDRGVVVVDEGPIVVPPPVGAQSAEKVQRQVERQAGLVGASTSTGGGTLFTERVLVVNQKAKILELTNEYAVYDAAGRQIGGVRQVGQSAARKVLRALTSIDQYLKTRLEVVGMDGQPLLELTRPPKVFKSTVVVTRPDGAEVGRIVQQNMVGKINFSLEVGGSPVGAIKAENWRAWNFRIEDAGGREVARITKTWEGLAKTMFTTADNYVVQIHERPDRARSTPSWSPPPCPWTPPSSRTIGVSEAEAGAAEADLGDRGDGVAGADGLARLRP